MSEVNIEEVIEKIYSDIASRRCEDCKFYGLKISDEHVCTYCTHEDSPLCYKRFYRGELKEYSCNLWKGVGDD